MITDEAFRAYLQCATKAYLKVLNTPEPEGEFAEWRRRQAHEFGRSCFTRLCAEYSEQEVIKGTPLDQIAKTRPWRLACDCLVRGQEVESRLHALEKIPSAGNGDRTICVPIRFVPSEKITRDDRLLLAFDAVCIAEACGQIPAFGKIIHGSEQKTVKVQMAALEGIVRATIAEMIRQQAIPPPLLLNKHCAECEFRPRCRQSAIEKDELSLLSGMTPQERQNQHSKGIFTVTQLSYTFRPRRRPKRLAAKPEKYHHALRALAIREGKIHIAGAPALKRKGTAVYLDVEGCPDRDFYYLIGLRIQSGESHAVHSLWADAPSQEIKIWREFLQLLAQLDDPQLIYYGSYETTFLKRMKERYGDVAAATKSVDQLLAEGINILAITYAQIYFPTYSNGLKDVAGWLGYQWSETRASGVQALMWREDWEHSHDENLKQKLITYNLEDCEALEMVASTVERICQGPQGAITTTDDMIVDTATMKVEGFHLFGKQQFALSDFDYINRAAYWDYQREKIHIRQGKSRKRTPKKRTASRIKSLRINKTIECAPLKQCPNCGSTHFSKNACLSKIVYDLKISHLGVKRWTTKYNYIQGRCNHCRSVFYSEDKTWSRSQYGPQLLGYIIYQIVELKLHLRAVSQHMEEVFGFHIGSCSIKRLKTRATEYYMETYERILRRIVDGKLVHADETRANIKGIHGYVWVLTSMEEVVYIHTATREGESIQKLLKEFKGVLVSDFYAVYDSIDCPQQKCLVHLMRDLNDDLIREPFNQEMKDIVREFAGVLKPAIETVDQYGLKARHVHKHKVFVARFFRMLEKREFKTETGIKYKQRFEKNRDKLFTFSDHDGVPWNNNNAEHAVKAYAALRKMISVSTAEEGLREYLTLLSISETCKYKEVSFLDFLRSGYKDVDDFVATIRRSRRG